MASQGKPEAGAPAPAHSRTVTLWDPVVRLFHWALVISFFAAWGLGKFGPDQMTLHFYAGYTIGALVVLRIIWGFVGPRPARFTSFVKGPSAILAYARHLRDRRPSNTLGHNPVGAIFVVGILTVLAVQVGTGLIGDPEDYVNVGPLADMVTIETSRSALGIHELLGNLAFFFVLFHIAAIGFYKRWKGEDLVTPMITGKKVIEEPVE
ncbi:MAG: cytochrome b/b6 domain-containing protein [Paracoccaceae bacterium]